MYYQYTGQPGHGKTVLAIEFAINMRDAHIKKQEDARAKGKPVPPDRQLYVCNIRDFNAAKVGAIELTPEQVQRWHLEPDFDHAIFLIDECYEHGMFPKRAPGVKVPAHVEQVAKHRHRGIDFIMVCQSPTKQMDSFLHDLIEEHYHIRRRYGLPLVNIRRFDKYEPRPERAHPLTISRKRYPKHIFKLYTSTKYDTSEKRVPWFYWAAAILLVFVIGMAWYSMSRVNDRLTTKTSPSVTGPAGNGGTTVPAGPGAESEAKWSTKTDYAESHLPRFGTMPWTAPIYDGRGVTADPQLICMSSSPGQMADGTQGDFSCTCLTEQGTYYDISVPECRLIARRGPVYNPYRQNRSDQSQQRQQHPLMQAAPVQPAGVVVPGNMSKVEGAGPVL